MSFTFLFYKNIMFRKSCGKCHFTNTKRPSDITIADFWGWEKTDSKFNADNKGVSLVLLNSEKGRILFEAVKDRMIVFPTDIDSCMQPNMETPTKQGKGRDKFERDYITKGFKYVYFKYGEEGWRYKAKYLLRLWKRIIAKIKKQIQ